MNTEENEGHQPNDKPTFTNYAEMMPEQTAEKSELSALGKTTIPESRLYEPTDSYRFLIHSTVQGDPREVYSHLTGGVEPGGEFQLTDHQLNTSLIDHAHTATFEGEGGLVIRPPRDSASIRGAYASDVGGAGFRGDQPHTTGNDLMARTAVGDYNHVNITAGAVEGVFIRIAADTGEELGDPNRNTSLRALASEHDLPVAELSVQPREIHDAPPSYEDAGETEGGGHLWHVTVPREGYMYRVDIARMGNGAIGTRAAQIDRYDVWNRNMTEAQFSELDNALVDLATANPDDTAIAAARAEIARQRTNQ